MRKLCVSQVGFAGCYGIAPLICYNLVFA